ncbi:hypothetical protein ABT115_21975 [Streptomyces sp. NPDC001832]|uniref:hypothetical protein n=1 Tax=Streptomyces sp. NPDC001832 TaxID=3154527 RepID=UPI003324BC32
MAHKRARTEYCSAHDTEGREKMGADHQRKDGWWTQGEADTVQRGGARLASGAFAVRRPVRRRPR